MRWASSRTTDLAFVLTPIPETSKVGILTSAGLVLTVPELSAVMTLHLPITP